jgi:hypothetical protein
VLHLCHTSVTFDTQAGTPGFPESLLDSHLPFAEAGTRTRTGLPLGGFQVKNVLVPGCPLLAYVYTTEGDASPGPSCVIPGFPATMLQLVLHCGHSNLHLCYTGMSGHMEVKAGRALGFQCLDSPGPKTLPALFGSSLSHAQVSANPRVVHPFVDPWVSESHADT